jgi:hypothetical protein
MEWSNSKVALGNVSKLESIHIKDGQEQRIPDPAARGRGTVVAGMSCFPPDGG